MFTIKINVNLTATIILWPKLLKGEKGIMAREKIFYERLLHVALQSRKTINCIERELGLPRNSLHNYKNGAEPSAHRLLELAKYFNVSPQYLLGSIGNRELSFCKDIFQQLDNKQKVEMFKVSQEWGYNQLSEYGHNIQFITNNDGKKESKRL